MNQYENTDMTKECDKLKPKDTQSVICQFKSKGLSQSKSGLPGSTIISRSASKFPKSRVGGMGVNQLPFPKKSIV